jgi:hypothetical protein
VSASPLTWDPREGADWAEFGQVGVRLIGGQAYVPSPPGQGRCTDCLRPRDSGRVWLLPGTRLGSSRKAAAAVFREGFCESVVVCRGCRCGAVSDRL